MAFNNRVVPMNMPDEIWMTDTTFRDGQQSTSPFPVEQIVHLFKLLSRLLDGKKGATGVIYAVSGVLGSLTNTLLVMGGIYVFFGKSYATAMDISFNLLLGIIGTTILTNGVLEAIVGGLVACGVCIPMKKMMRRTLPL